MNKANLWQAIDRFMLLGVAVCYLAAAVFPAPWLTSLQSVLVLMAILLLLPRLRGAIRIMVVMFIATGAAILLAYRASPHVWLASLNINVTLATLFLFAPLFGIPVKMPRYTEAIRGLFHRHVAGKAAFFWGTQLITQLLAVVISVGSISVVHHLVTASPYAKSVRLLATAMHRGFSAAVLWSPYFAAMAVVTSSLSVEWTSLLPCMFGLILIYLVLSHLTEMKQLADESRLARPLAAAAGERGGAEAYAAAARERSEAGPYAAAAGEQSGAGAYAAVAGYPSGENGAKPIGKPLLHLAAYLGLAISLVLLLEMGASVPIVLAVCLVALVFPLIWCLASRSMTTFRQGILTHLDKTIPSLSKEIVLFLSAGFISGAVGVTPAGRLVPELLASLPVSLPLLFSYFALLLILVSSYLGLHPIVAVTILVTNVDPASVGITPASYAVILLGGWSLSNMISPASAVNNLIANLLGRSVVEISRLNIGYSLVMAAILPMYLRIYGM